MEQSKNGVGLPCKNGNIAYYAKHCVIISSSMYSNTKMYL